jgi:hypothetical protein
MSNRWLRFGIAIVAIGAASAAGYRVYQQQQRLVISIERTRATDVAAEAALTTIPEIKAALHAYVAEGQGYTFWTARAASLIDKLRASMLELDGAATGAGVPLTDSLNLADRLEASEQRARDHVHDGQRLLAGEVIFTEARDVLDAMRTQLARAHTTIADTEATSQAAMRREQSMLVLSSGGILVLTIVVLVSPGRAKPAVAPAAIKPAAAEPADEFESSARIISRTPIKPPTATPAASPAAAAKPAGAVATTTPRPPTLAKATPEAKPTAEGKPSTDAAAAAVAPSLREAAAICTELGRASQSIEVSNLLARAAKVLDASGAIVWMTSADGRELYPAVSTGYDDRLLTRIGTIPRSANNVTASAIRTGTVRTSPRAGQSAAAVAIPLLTPLGAVGVLSAEMKNVPEVDDTRLAVATIFAAQLAGLVGSKATASSAAAKANAVT